VSEVVGEGEGIESENGIGKDGRRMAEGKGGVTNVEVRGEVVEDVRDGNAVVGKGEERGREVEEA